MPDDVECRQRVAGAVALVFAAAMLYVEREAVGVPPPLNRTWHPFVPLLALAAFTEVDAVLAARPRRIRGPALVASLAAVCALVAHFAANLDLRVYREWPENAAVPALLDAMPESGGRVTVACALAQQMCIAFWADRSGRSVDTVLVSDEVAARRAQYLLVRAPRGSGWQATEFEPVAGDTALDMRLRRRR